MATRNAVEGIRAAAEWDTWCSPRLGFLVLLPLFHCVLLMAASVLVAVVADDAGGAAPLPAFAYRKVTVELASAEGRPVSGAAVYGYCRELNLAWPRPHKGDADANQYFTLWQEAFLERTDAEGKVTAEVPPGRWGWVAVAEIGGKDGREVLAVWKDYDNLPQDGVVHLQAEVERSWLFYARRDVPVRPSRLYVKPVQLPVWVPLDCPAVRPSDELGKSATGAAQEAPTQPVVFHLPSRGSFSLWGQGAPAGGKQGFILSWGDLLATTPDGARFARPEATVEIRGLGAGGIGTFSWCFSRSPGLAGQVALASDSSLLLSAGDWTVGYTRPVGAGMTGEFAAQSYELTAGRALRFDFSAPLSSAIDQNLRPPDDKGRPARFSARLYTVDGNGHLLRKVLDSQGKPVVLTAEVRVGDGRYEAKPAPAGATRFELDPKLASNSISSFIWQVRGPEGLLGTGRLVPQLPAEVRSGSFRTEVPGVLRPVAADLLNEMEALAQRVEAVSGRRRRVTPTTLRVYPYFPGASASHDGSFINFDGGVFYDEIPGFSHGCAHELTHNFAFTHGGLQELVVEVVRSGGEQVSGQEQKWLFLDRMNGLKRTDTWYPNTGLYLYCYSQGGKRFLGFVLTWEDKVRKALSAQHFSDDEVTAALCSLGVGRDLLVTCQRWGLNVSQPRLQLATRAARQVTDASP